MRPRTRMLLLSMLVGIVSPLAMADALVNVKSEVVRYDDLRLISAVGAAVLYGRLHVAAERACGGPLEGQQQLVRQQRHHACVDSALEKAVSDVNHPVLTQYYESKQNKPASDRLKNSSAVADAR